MIPDSIPNESRVIRIERIRIRYEHTNIRHDRSEAECGTYTNGTKNVYEWSLFLGWRTRYAVVSRSDVLINSQKGRTSEREHDPGNR